MCLCMFMILKVYLSYLLKKQSMLLFYHYKLLYIAVILLCDYHYVYFTWLYKHNIFILAVDL